MSQPDHFFTIEATAHAEYKDRGSKFLAYAFALSAATEFKMRLRTLKEEHPKAAHHCFAYRIGLGGDNFRVSDDGEPSGSAGKPILGQIDTRQLTNTGIIVVRYFGGTLLGVPGLIAAYKTVSSLALQMTPVVQRPVLETHILEFDYTGMNEVMVLLKKLGCVVLRNETQLFCLLEVGVPRAALERFQYELKNLPGVLVRTG